MWITSELASRTKRQRCSRRHNPSGTLRQARRRLRFEPLERRTLLSLSGPTSVWFSPVAADLEAEFLSGGTGVDVLEQTPKGISARLSLPGVVMDTVSVEQGQFISLRVPGWGWGSQLGQAALPVFYTTFVVPDGVQVTAEFEIDNSVVLAAEYPVYPLQPPEPDEIDVSVPQGSGAFAYDADYYAGATVAQPGVLTLGDPVVARGTSVVSVGICPFRYEPATGEIEAVTELSFSLDFSEGESPDGPSGRSGSRLDLEEVDPAVLEADYLMITADAFYEEVLPLAEWKHKKGFKTYLATLSEVGETPSDIQDFIYTAYHNGAQTAYVVLVGDHDDVPTNDMGGWVSDHPYACVDGEDYLPDLTLGRLSVHTEAEATALVNKILTYDRSPDEGNWYDDALMAAYFQDDGGEDPPVSDGKADRFFMETVHHVSDFLGGDFDFWTEPGDPHDQGYTVHTALTATDWNLAQYYYHEEKPYPGRPPYPFPVPTSWTSLWTSGSTASSDITIALNSGVGLVQHRDHGGCENWSHPYFDVEDVNSLENGVMTPVVFSTNCLTGTFDYADGDCFAEAFLKHPAGGAVGVVGATRTSYSGYNDSMVNGTYTCFWPDYDPEHSGNPYPHSMRPAEAMNFGKFYMYSYFGDCPTTQLEFNEFHWFGDPEMMLRTGTPFDPVIEHPASVTVGHPTDFRAHA